MPCDETRNLIDDWFDLEEEVRQSIALHAEGCIGCRKRLEETLEVLRELANLASVYRGLHFPAVVALRSPGRARRSRRALIRAVAASLVILAGSFFWRSLGPPGPYTEVSGNSGQVLSVASLARLERPPAASGFTPTALPELAELVPQRPSRPAPLSFRMPSRPRLDLDLP